MVTACKGSSGGPVPLQSGGAGGSSAVGGSVGSGGMLATGGSTPAATGGRGGSSTGGAANAGGSAAGGSVAGGSTGSGGSAPDGAIAGDVFSALDGGPDRDLAMPDATIADVPAADTVSDRAPADATSGVYKPAFILGADVTITLEDEYWGATYTDDGKQKPIEQILKDHGFNFVRLDTFVNPGAPGGYAEGKPEAFRDLAHTITLAKRFKKLGMGFMLDFHYSDTWTNAGAQTPPTAWAGLSAAALQDKVYAYTKDAITQLRNEGAMPDMVSIGNEIANGLLWSAGSITNSNFTGFAALLKAGVRGVRDADAAIVVVMHLDKCNDFKTTAWWLDGVLGQGVSFDVLGQSCYAKGPNGVAAYQGTPAEWKATFDQLATAYPTLKFLIAEYSAEQRAAGDVMHGLPNKRGLGTFNWDPTRAYDTHPNDPLFSTDGAWNHYVAIPNKMGLYDQMALDYGLRPAP